MVSINYATREVSCKIVYYGPGLSGKTTNLQYVHEKVPSNTKGKLISLATDADRTLYFDFLPINIGKINGFDSKFQLYTVPGQVYYNATRKLVLRGVDGLVFVADSQPDKMDENIESLNNLKENLAEYGYDVNEIPIVIQYNKQDLPDVMTPEEMKPVLNPRGWPEYKASATEGFGVFDTLKCILKLVLDKARTGGTTPGASKTASVPSAASEVSSEPAAADVSETKADVSAARERIPDRDSPVPEKTAAAASHEPAEQPQSALDTGRIQTAEAPQPSSGAEGPQREPVSEASSSGPAYRPFPGNTLEDEKRMEESPVREYPGTGKSSSTDEISSPESGGKEDTDASGMTGTPRMAPSLKAEKPRKKRSFFKRLFGLK